MSSARRKWITGFYWLGVLMVVLTVAVVAAGHTERFGKIERFDFSLTWACAGIAFVALLAAELCHSVSSPPPAKKSPASAASAPLPEKVSAPLTDVPVDTPANPAERRSGNELQEMF